MSKIQHSQVVVDGVTYIRANGNSPSGGRERSLAGLKQAPVWVQEKAKSAAKRRLAEAEYTRRYLSDDTQT